MTMARWVFPTRSNSEGLTRERSASLAPSTRSPMSCLGHSEGHQHTLCLSSAVLQTVSSLPIPECVEQRLTQSPAQKRLHHGASRCRLLPEDTHEDQLLP